MIQFAFNMPLWLMGVYGGAMVLVVLALRLLLGRWLPKRVMPVLWAVLAALESGKLRTYATDVFCDEPCGGDNPLALHPHCIATPHVAWSPRETRQKIVDIAVDNIRAFAAGTPKNLVSAV